MQQLASTGLTVLLLVIALVAIGAAMVWLAVWLTRSTRTDAPALGPLEAMGTRRFRRADEAAKTTRLSGARPDGAPAPAPIVAFEDAPAEHLPPTEQPEETATERAEAESSAPPVDEAPEEETAPTVNVAEAPVVVSSVLAPPSPLELETDEDERVTDQLNAVRVQEPR